MYRYVYIYVSLLIYMYTCKNTTHIYLRNISDLYKQFEVENMSILWINAGTGILLPNQTVYFESVFVLLWSLCFLLPTIPWQLDV